MTRDQIKVGGRYRARIRGRWTTVRVLSITARPDNSRGGKKPYTRLDYQVEDESTGRRVTFGSPAAFRCEVQLTSLGTTAENGQTTASPEQVKELADLADALVRRPTSGGYWAEDEDPGRPDLWD